MDDHINLILVYYLSSSDLLDHSQINFIKKYLDLLLFYYCNNNVMQKVDKYLKIYLPTNTYPPVSLASCGNYQPNYWAFPIGLSNIEVIFEIGQVYSEICTIKQINELFSFIEKLQSLFTRLLLLVLIINFIRYVVISNSSGLQPVNPANTT